MPPFASRAGEEAEEAEEGRWHPGRSLRACAATPPCAARDGRVRLRDATTAEQVREALRDGADANAQDEQRGWGRTAAALAARYGCEHDA